jgi:hypothetical protein
MIDTMLHDTDIAERSSFTMDPPHEKTTSSTSFYLTEEEKKNIPMPPPLSINVFGRILLKQNFTANAVIYYDGEKPHQLLANIVREEINSGFYDRMVMTSIFFFITNPLLQTPLQKFGYLETIQSNSYFSTETKQMFTRAFENAQRLYHILGRFANRLRYRYSKLRIQTDLILNPIHETHRNVVVVYHYGSRYLFTIMDITKIIENSLLNSKMLISDPIAVKNPYNNLPFTKSNLYNLYFQLKSREFVLSAVFHNYFLCNFSLRRFKRENEVAIRNEAIDRYISGSNEVVLTKEIRNMLKWYNARCDVGCAIHVNKDFPKDRLIIAMKPFLGLYLKHTYSLDINAQYYYEYKLDEALERFVRKFPLFGCKTRKRIEGTNTWKITFHDMVSEREEREERETREAREAREAQEKEMRAKEKERASKRKSRHKKYETCHLECETSSDEEDEDDDAVDANGNLVNRRRDFIAQYTSHYVNDLSLNRVIRHDIVENEIINELVANLTQEQMMNFTFTGLSRSRALSAESSVGAAISYDSDDEDNDEVVIRLSSELEEGEVEQVSDRSSSISQTSDSDGSDR